jgi:hypothetical protein
MRPVRLFPPKGDPLWGPMAFAAIIVSVWLGMVLTGWIDLSLLLPEKARTDPTWPYGRG